MKHLFKIKHIRLLLLLGSTLMIFLIYKIFLQKLTNENPEGINKCIDCNIIIISLNYFRKDHMQCFGYNRKTASNLCRFVKKGILFDNFIVQSYLTPISQMSIFTSLYPSNTKYVFFHSVVDKIAKTLPEIIKAENYRTIAFGSSPILMPNASGYPNATVNNKNKMSFSSGFDKYYYVGRVKLPYESLTWLDINKNNGKFFMWLPIASLHWPHALWGDAENKKKYDPFKYNGLFKDLEYISGNVMLFLYKNTLYDHKKNKQYKITEEDKKYIISKYDYDMYQFDQFFSELIQQLKKSNLLENTLIVLHGSHANDLDEHGYFSDYDIYDNETNTLLFIYNPKTKLSNRRIEEQIEGIDLMPTVLDILDIKTPASAKGRNINTYLGSTFPKISYAYTERMPPFEIQLIKNKNHVPPKALEKLKKFTKHKKFLADTSIRSKNWKLIHRRYRLFEEKIGWWTLISGEVTKRNKYELYNNNKDPYNKNNVINKHPNVAKKLINKLQKWEDQNTYPVSISH